ncbi:cache domain-containing protein [Elusimicrobiota bacterium]
MPEKKRKGKLLYKFLVLFVGLAIIPLIVVRVRVLDVGQKSMSKESRKVHLEIARRSADTVTSFVGDIKNMLFVIQKPKEFVEMNIMKQKAILGNMMKSYPTFMKIAVTDMTGMVRLKIPRFGKIEIDPGVDHSEHALFKEAIENGEYVSKAYRSAEKYPFLLISVPIEKFVGNPVGVIAAEINLIALSNMIAQIKIGTKGYTYVVDEKGIPIAHPDQKIVLQGESLADIPIVAEALKSKTEGGGEFEYKGEKLLGTYVPVEELDWRIIAQQPISEAYLPAAKMKDQINIFLIGALLITVSIGIFFSYKLVKPIKILMKSTERVASGQFETDIGIVIKSSDEIGELATKFNFMSNSLAKMTGELKDANAELDKWNKELEDRVEERTRQLREAQEQLVQSERLAAVGQMANVVGHEIRNPLASMKSAIFLIGELTPKDDEDIKECIDVINREIIASEKICENMLGFSRTRKPVREPVDVNELLEESFSILEQPESVEVTKEFEQGLPQANIDRNEIRQVLANLIKNGFEIMDEKTGGGKLLVKSLSKDGMIELIFKDTGPGISAENMKKMFTPFFSTKARGTGLGLSACQNIILRHGGKIWVESEGEGKGSTFFVQISIEAKEVEVNESGEVESPPNES